MVNERESERRFREREKWNKYTARAGTRNAVSNQQPSRPVPGYPVYSAVSLTPSQRA